ncbi:venom prothrombin activator hopsarin-D-like [Zophobas morio]|uniref:venom prothrombin activator hopsarin-D-like n=1 Tax=Zophobas morio TaxID=2755281 RepID=UPI00308322D0
MNATDIFAFLFTCVVTYSLVFPRIHTHDEVKFRIVGGVEGNKEKFPYVVSLRGENNNHLCGGTLIKNEYVITAAHCVARTQARSLIVTPLDGYVILSLLKTEMLPLVDKVHIKLSLQPNQNLSKPVFYYGIIARLMAISRFNRFCLFESYLPQS